MIARVIEADGFKWSVQDDDDHLALGGHEAALYPILVGMSNSNKTFLNIGAHVGLWAIRLASHFALVDAWEINPATVKKLWNNIELNNLEGTVWVTEYAAWDEDDISISLEDPNGFATGGSTYVVPDTNGAMQAATLKIDSMRYAAPVGLITMDVEGAEARVLRGARNTIMQDRPNMVIELHEGHPGAPQNLRNEVYALLDQMNYQYVSVDITGERLLCTPHELVLDEPETVSLQNATDGGSILTEQELIHIFER